MVQRDGIISASKNPREMIRILSNIISDRAVKQLEKELKLQAIKLFHLGEAHFNFAKNLPDSEWRQRVSRGYYGAYNCKRALSLYMSGQYSTDASDHKKISEIPDDFPQRETRVTRLRDLREDRNTSDYDHAATEEDLLIDPKEAIEFCDSFIQDIKKYLYTNGCRVR